VLIKPLFNFVMTCLLLFYQDKISDQISVNDMRFDDSCILSTGSIPHRHFGPILARPRILVIHFHLFPSINRISYAVFSSGKKKEFTTKKKKMDLSWIQPSFNGRATNYPSRSGTRRPTPNALVTALTPTAPRLSHVAQDDIQEVAHEDDLTCRRIVSSTYIFNQYLDSGPVCQRLLSGGISRHV
jgi:hypothetical protein